MTAAIVGENGVVTLPPQVLDGLNLLEGDRIELVLLGDGQCLLVPANRSVCDLKGMFGTPDKPVSIAEMDRAISGRGKAGSEGS